MGAKAIPAGRERPRLSLWQQELLGKHLRSVRLLPPSADLNLVFIVGY